MAGKQKKKIHAVVSKNWVGGKEVEGKSGSMTHAKKSILMAMASPAWSAMTAISRPWEVLIPVALKTGYLHLKQIR